MNQTPATDQANPAASADLAAKQAHLFAALRSLGAVAVAFSAGVDSTYLLAACCDALEPRHVLAVTACSPTLPRREVDAAYQIAALLGVRLEVIVTHELENPAYACNDRLRCFHCKDELFRCMQPVAASYGLQALIYGAIADDVGDERPGMRAAAQHNVQAPLLDAGMSKADVRALSRLRGLPTHDKPALACLASRIPYGSPITLDVLRQVDQAEAFLRSEIGFSQVRVRHHGALARIEIDAHDIPRAAEPGIRERIVAYLGAVGFTYVTLDLAGFRSGSMNALPDAQPASHTASDAAVRWLEPAVRTTHS